jgi:GMP synthase-like glutamine amidotransferase
MRVGILETGEVAEGLRAVHGDYPAMFDRLLRGVDPDLEFATVSVVRGEMPAAPGQADGWIVTGSRHGVYDGLDWIEPLKDFLRDCVAEGVPVVGICFGHQILAEALGGRAAKSDRGWGVGVHDYELRARPGWLDGLPERFAVRAIHQDQVIELPPEATVLAASAFCPYAALAYGHPERPSAISLQPHPEFDAAFLDALLVARAGTVVPERQAAAARESLARPVDDAAWARLIVAFLRRAAAGIDRDEGPAADAGQASRQR